MAITTEVFISFPLPGIHAWGDCDEKEQFYLKYPHRHEFLIKAYKKVSHNNREVEIIKLRNLIEEFLKSEYFSDTFGLCDFGGMSCEDIAFLLLQEFDLTEVEVLEDGELGARIRAY